MAYRLLAGQATSLALLWGAALSPLVVVDANAAVASAQSPSPRGPGLMLAKNWQARFDPLGFLVSEKLDGVRAYWDGKVLRFRSGRLIAAPKWFTDALPNTALDGELWIARQRFDRLSAIVRRNVPVDNEWRDLKYMIFDVPKERGRFDERATRVVSVVEASKVPWLQAVTQFHITDPDALQRQLQELVSEGGEGFVLHRADAEWQAGRSDALFKLKPEPDEDARVVGYVPGKGRLTGRMGALLLESPTGQRFALGTGFSDEQRKTPPGLGTVVTYRYRDRTATGLPRFASFLRVREAE
jgi:DNA ligase-1